VRLTVVGVAAGMVTALGLTRFITRQLFGTSPLDPMTFAAVALLLSTVAIAACCVPT
jgi:hypothetical protein